MQEIFYRMQRQLKGGISMKKFRCAHILCIPSFTGERDTVGTFCDNMTQKVPGTEGRPGRTAHARDRPGYDLYALSEPDTG